MHTVGSPPVDADAVARAARVAALGHDGPLSHADLGAARAATADPEPAVRAAAVAALVRAGPVRDAARAWSRATGDPEAAVRRRVADVAPALQARRRVPDPAATDALVGLLRDPDVTVVEAAAWALGETVTAPASGPVTALAAVVTEHDDALAREAAVAALGAIGDPDGLPAVLAACRDKPAVRRRAVLALAPFDGPEVDEALALAHDDRDWQVRQAAEDLQ
jgi:HEAT repeat protein